MSAAAACVFFRHYAHRRGLSMRDLSKELGQRPKYLGDALACQGALIHSAVMRFRDRISFPADIVAWAEHETAMNWKRKTEVSALTQARNRLQAAGKSIPITAAHYPSPHPQPVTFERWAA